MLYISHRGNTNGSVPESENNPSYIEETISIGYHVEVDVWVISGKMFLGHDSPVYPTEYGFARNPKILCHAKNPEALRYFSGQQGFHYFWHENDKYTMTNQGIIISYPGFTHAGPRTIIMKPEHHNGNTEGFFGICSDYIGIYKNAQQNT